MAEIKKEDQEIINWCDDIAALIVDTMVDAKLVKADEFEEAIPVVSMEIYVRFLCGDYPPPCKPKQLI